MRSLLAKRPGSIATFPLRPGRAIGSRERQTPAIVDRRSLRPGDGPDVPFGVAPAEPAAPRGLERLLQQLDIVDSAQGLVHRPGLGKRFEVDAEREAAEPVRGWAEVRLVVLRGVDRDHAAVRALERALVVVALGRLRPAEVAEEAGHALDVTARERDQPDPVGELHGASLRQALVSTGSVAH